MIHCLGKERFSKEINSENSNVACFLENVGSCNVTFKCSIYIIKIL